MPATTQPIVRTRTRQGWAQRWGPIIGVATGLLFLGGAGLGLLDSRWETVARADERERRADEKREQVAKQAAVAEQALGERVQEVRERLIRLETAASYQTQMLQRLSRQMGVQPPPAPAPHGEREGDEEGP